MECDKRPSISGETSFHKNIQELRVYLQCAGAICSRLWRTSASCRGNDVTIDAGFCAEVHDEYFNNQL